MLKPSYTAIKQFQSQISSINTLQKAKALGSSLGISISIEVSSSFWMLDWNLSDATISGTLELKCLPKLSVGKEVFIGKSARTLRIEDANPTRLDALEFELMKIIKNSVNSIKTSGGGHE